MLKGVELKAQRGRAGRATQEQEAGHARVLALWKRINTVVNQHGYGEDELEETSVEHSLDGVDFVDNVDKEGRCGEEEARDNGVQETSSDAALNQKRF